MKRLMRNLWNDLFERAVDEGIVAGLSAPKRG